MSISMYSLIFATVAALGIAVVAFLMYAIGRVSVDNAKAKQIAHAIRGGAMTFLKAEYSIIAVAVIIITACIAFGAQNMTAACAFACASLMSMATGYIGMCAATAANVRTALAAKNQGEHAAFMIAFFGGGVMGFAVASFGLAGLGALFYLYYDRPDLALILTSFAFGCSLVAFFARIGGGIYSKSADVGADLVGKIEAGIPEDDPRNPAVIADNVGDCVGDTAGMGADIYESYIGAMVSSIILALSTGITDINYVSLPLMLSALGLGASALGLFSNLFLKQEPS